MFSFPSDKEVMESVDGSRSIEGISDEIFLNMCDPCKYSGTEKESSTFCDDCKEYLCSTCTESHKGLKLSRNHKLLLMKEMSEVQTATSCIVFCDCIRNSTVTNFCVDHDEVMCQTCKTVKHAKCNTLTISEKSNTYSEIKLNSVIQKAAALKNEIQAFLNERNADLKRLQPMAEKCKDDINRFRQELNKYLDVLEENLLRILEKHETLERQEMEQNISACGLTLQQLETDSTLLDDAWNTEEKGNMFVTDLKVSHRLEDYERWLQNIRQESKSTNITFKRNDDLLEMQTKVKELGTLTIDYINSYNCRSTSKLFTNLKIESCSQVDIKQKHGNYRPNITGCVFMPNGELVLCDNAKYIILLSNSFVFKDSLELESGPWDVSAVNNNSVVITLPELQQLRYLQVVPVIKTGRVIQVDAKYYAVDVVDDEIYTTCCTWPAGEVRILDNDGNIKRRIGVKSDQLFHFMYPYHLRVSKTSGKIYLSDRGTGTLTCMAPNGSVAYKYSDSDKDLKYLGGVCVDTGDNIIVCGERSNNAHIVCTDGTKSHSLLTHNDSIKSPLSVAYRLTDDSLVFGCSGDNALFVCRVTHNV